MINRVNWLERQIFSHNEDEKKTNHKIPRKKTLIWVIRLCESA